MPSTDRGLVVLGWHNVRPTCCFPAAPGAGQRGLAGQLRTLRRLANVVPLESALRDLAAGRRLPPRAVAITFDDGYADNLELAGPMLRDLNLPATCFLVPGILDGTVVPWWERLTWILGNGRSRKVRWKDVVHDLTGPDRRTVAKSIAEDVKRCDRRAREAAIDEIEEQLDPAGRYDAATEFLDWDGARRLQQYFTIGSHTTYHNIMAQETAEAQHADLVGARRRLVDELDSGIAVLAYPNGKSAEYHGDPLAAAMAAGHEFSVTTRNGLTNRDTPPHEIRRWVMNPHRGPVDFAKIVKDLVTQGRG